jgi:predicted phage-related endonuclease
MKVSSCEQGSEEWHLLRAGILTGTDADSLMTPKKYETLLIETLAERLSNDPTDDENPMLRGKRKEAEARKLYAEITGYEVKQIGFAQKDNEPVGDSPDGVIEKDGKIVRVFEAKCLSSKEHLKIVLSNEIPKEHRQQCIHKFTVYPDCEAVDFFAFDPRISVRPYVLVTLKRDDVLEEIKEYRTLQEQFIKDLNTKLTQILI